MTDADKVMNLKYLESDPADRDQEQSGNPHSTLELLTFS